jgi:circadian clock protein KaiC
VIYEDLGRTLNEGGLAGALECITELLKRNRPGLVVIDSFRALQTYAADPETFRGFLHKLAGRLSAMPITSFWVGEYNTTDTSDAPEFAVADAILSLGTEREGDRDRRVLSVIKLRGSESLSGKHAYRLSSAGIHAFPRMADLVNLERYDRTQDRMSSGVPALDAMLSDGYYRGASTLLAGPSGVGKTLLALHFIFAGAERGETGLIATFQENPTQLERILNGFSWSLDDPGVELMYRDAVLRQAGQSRRLASLQFLRGDSQLKRALTVVKARGSAHDPFTRQYEITSDGVILDDHFDRNQNLT